MLRSLQFTKHVLFRHKSCKITNVTSVSDSVSAIKRQSPGCALTLSRWMSSDSASEEMKENLVDMKPVDFIDYLKKNKIRRCFMVHNRETNAPQVSHPELQGLADFFAKDEIDYDGHEGIFMMLGMRTNVLMGAFVWRTCRGQAVSIIL